MLLMWDVNYRTLDIRRKEESLRNDVNILDSILNVCVFKVNGCCVICQVMKLSLTKEIWEVWFGAWTSIHLVYVRILGKGITLHRLLRGNDDNSEIGIGNVLSENNYGWSYEVDNGRGIGF